MRAPFPLRLDLEYAKRGFARYAAYPAATWAGLFTNVVVGFMRVYILLALFDQRAEIGGYDRTAVVTYAWATQALIATIYIWGWQEISLRIRSGDIATDLIRPVHPLRAGLAFDLGRSVYHLIFRGLPPLAVGAVVYGILWPPDALGWALALLSLILAVILSYEFRAIYNLASFWLMDHRGTMLIAVAAANIFSGITAVPMTKCSCREVGGKTTHCLQRPRGPSTDSVEARQAPPSRSPQQRLAVHAVVG